MALLYALALAVLAFIVFLVVLVFLVIQPISITPNLGSTTMPYGNGTTGSSTTYTTTVNQSFATTTIEQGGGNYSSLDNYVLSLINQDRSQYGLGSVTLSAEPSAEQHSQSMMDGQYFSHWDPYGMKPYMRYTVLGGTGAVSENIATNYSSVCLATLCHGTVNVTSALRSMEYDMMYNDLQCCGNGHRDNILDPNHTSVSIGISYNSSRIYLTQDFIDDYISWAAGPGYAANGEVTLQGQTGGGTGMDSIEISYDPPIANMTRAQLNATTDYGYGNPIAGVVSNPSLYYSGITTITADRYQVSGNQFDIRFNMQSLVNQYGAGEYTLLMFLNRTGAPGSFLGSTYTIFINGQGAAYAPTNV